MSFSGDVKSELCRFSADTQDCCKLAECYGALLLGKSFSPRMIKFSSEYEFAAEHICDLVNYCLKGDVCSVVKNKQKYQVEITDKSVIQKIYSLFGHSERQLNLRINRANLANADCCHGAFLRGAFLSCGTVTDPQRNYHLEFIIPFMKLSQDFCKLIDDSDLSVKQTVRKGSHVIYIKDSESIEDMLTFMGAQLSSLEIMNIKVEKDVRNRVNRKINFECANIERSVKAGMKQVEAIDLIIRKQGLDSLDPEYKELAQLRMENPDMSLKQLSESLSEPISRSGVKHRLDKLIEMAENLKK